MKAKITRAIALALAALMAASFASCGKGSVEKTPTDAETTAVVDEVTTVVAEEPASEDSVTQAEEETEATVPETEAESVQAPTEKEDILKLYNDATAKVVSSKASYSKTRSTVEGVYEAGVALKAFKSVVYKFMGIGADNAYTKDVEKNDDNHDRYLNKSTLTVDDLKDATCTQNNDGGYDVVLKVKDGNSAIYGGENKSRNGSLDKSGICVGDGDKGYWDRKSAENVYDAIDEVSSKAVVEEKYSNATIKATIDQDGKITKMDVTFDIVFDISEIYNASGHATGTTTISYKNFKY